jgi:hypothetical protein
VLTASDDKVPMGPTWRAFSKTIASAVDIGRVIASQQTYPEPLLATEARFGSQADVARLPLGGSPRKDCWLPKAVLPK